MKLKRRRIAVHATRLVAPMLRLRKCHTIGGRIRSMSRKLKMASKIADG
jgi:hypothetical protein